HGPRLLAPQADRRRLDRPRTRPQDAAAPRRPGAAGAPGPGRAGARPRRQPDGREPRPPDLRLHRVAGLPRRRGATVGDGELLRHLLRGCRRRLARNVNAHHHEAVMNPYRLPQSVVPSRYDLRLEPDLAAARFAGEARITLTVRETVAEIVLN